jgi:hypothetical protein
MKKNILQDSVMKKIVLAMSVLFSVFSLSGSAVFSQNTHILKGRVLNGTTMTPVAFALVIIESANVVGNAPNGNYTVNVPKPGKYTVKVQSQGLVTLTTTVTIQGVVTRDFTLNATPAAGRSSVTIRGERDIQKISRQTMTAKQIKDVPASFGDSVSALTSLPGINRADGGFFGPLVIRGASESFNGYFVDDIPLYKPMHFGGIHSVINSNFMSEIDVYSSAFPAQFGNAQAAIINISTDDKCEKFGGYTNIGLISADAFVKAPLTKTVIVDGTAKEENTGYIMASGRYGYLTLFIPFFYEHIYHKSLDWLPQYWDYQFKAKYDINTHHSFTFLAFGSRDYIDLQVKSSWVDPADDPAIKNFSVYQNDQAHSVGLYYNYKLNDLFSNTLMTYGAFNRSDIWYNVPNTTTDWTKNLGTKSTPYIFGIKDKIKLDWWENHGEFRGGIEANYYYFKTSGKQLISAKSDFDINDPDSVTIEELGETIKNKKFASFAENKFRFGWVTLVPGVHTEYLARTKTTTVDPRGMASITFPTGTTIAAAGGSYSAFIQTNSYYFTNVPKAASYDYLKPQRSIHRSGSIEQKIEDVTVKIEGFNNYFYNMVIQDDYSVNGEQRSVRNGMKLKTYGAEFLVKLSDENEQGLFGWASYTYNRSKMITHQTGSGFTYTKIWYSSYYDMPHVAKIVAGYTYGRHTLSGKFQFSSQTPYTKITGSYEDINYETANPGVTRIVPTYGKPNTGRLDPSYRLDVRYSYKTNYKWGYVQWYIEAIGAIHSITQEYKWDYRYAYSQGENPKIVKQTDGLTVIPNFGVETKF